jgi:4-hydroxybenzoate polyprenyltransferase
VRLAQKNAAVAAVVFYIFAVALTPVTWFLGQVGIWFIPFVLVTDIGLVICSNLLLVDHSRRKSKKNKEGCSDTILNRSFSIYFRHN